MKPTLALAFHLTLLSLLPAHNSWQLNLGGPLPEKVLQILPSADGNLLVLAVIGNCQGQNGM